MLGRRDALEHALTKLLFDSVQGGAASSSLATQLGATLHRPKSMEDFAEMMNLFVMMAFSLGWASAVVTTDSFSACGL